jgi:protein-L-isoaspartate(D-aspartate) O-methyltransferase
MLPRNLVTAALLAMVMAGCGHDDRVKTPQDEYRRERRWMVMDQLLAPGRNIQDHRVLDAMMEVPRHEFVPEEIRHRAYKDGPLPIGHDQTISQPYIVAFMTEQVRPLTQDRVLEVGTGSGYQAAILSRLVHEVYTIEPLAARAAADLHRLGCTNVHVRADDGYAGWPEHAPFDVILVTCAPDHVPATLVEQFKEGGRMMIPVGPSDNATLYRLEKRGGRLVQEAVMPVRFVPMTGSARSP